MCRTIYSIIVIISLAHLYPPAKCEDIFVELGQGVYEGEVDSIDGQNFVKFLRIPLKLQEVGLAEDVAKSPVLKKLLQDINSDTDSQLHRCVFTPAVDTDAECIFINVYTTLQWLHLNYTKEDNETKKEVKFYVVDENHKYPKFSPNSSVLLTVKNKLTHHSKADEKIILGLTLEWMERNIEKFGGDPQKISMVMFSDETPALDDNKFVVGYELHDELNRVSPINAFESNSGSKPEAENAVFVDENTTTGFDENTTTGFDETTTSMPSTE